MSVGSPSTFPVEDQSVGAASYTQIDQPMESEKLAVSEAEEAIDLDSLVRNEAMIEEPDVPSVESAGSNVSSQHVEDATRIQGYDSYPPVPDSGPAQIQYQGQAQSGGVQGYPGVYYSPSAPPYASNGFQQETTASTPAIVDEGSPDVEVVGETGPTVNSLPGPSFRADHNGQAMTFDNQQYAPQGSGLYGQPGASAFQTGLPTGFRDQSFHSGSGSQLHPAASQSRYTSTPSVPSALSVPGPAASSSTSNNNNGAAIDLTDEDVASRYSQPTNIQPPQPAQLDMTDRRPICIGSIDTQALILYPIPIMQKGSNRDDLIRAGELRVDQGGEEWLKVKLKYRKGKVAGQISGAGTENGPSPDTVINIMSCKSSSRAGSTVVLIIGFVLLDSQADGGHRGR